MAIQIPITDDIRDYEPKLIGPFTKRQIIYAGIGFVLGIPFAFLIPDLILKVSAVATFTIGFAVLGNMKFNGLRGEEYLIRIAYCKLLTPRKRKYISTNLIRKSMCEMKAEEEKEKLSLMTKKEREKYLKEKNNKQIKYSNKKEYKIYR